MSARLADFGLSKGKKEGDEIMTRVQGTIGYLDPEYVKTTLPVLVCCMHVRFGTLDSKDVSHCRHKIQVQLDRSPHGHERHLQLWCGADGDFNWATGVRNGWNSTRHGALHCSPSKLTADDHISRINFD